MSVSPALRYEAARYHEARALRESHICAVYADCGPLSAAQYQRSLSELSKRQHESLLALIEYQQSPAFALRELRRADAMDAIFAGRLGNPDRFAKWALMIRTGICPRATINRAMSA